MRAHIPKFRERRLDRSARAGRILRIVRVTDQHVPAREIAFVRRRGTDRCAGQTLAQPHRDERTAGRITRDDVEAHPTATEISV
jgi:hypothetical protein